MRTTTCTILHEEVIVLLRVLLVLRVPSMPPTAVYTCQPDRRVQFEGVVGWRAEARLVCYRWFKEHMCFQVTT
jgi:hypothetical protein